jgi:hypothetical protein
MPALGVHRRFSRELRVRRRQRFEFVVRWRVFNRRRVELGLQFVGREFEFRFVVGWEFDFKFFIWRRFEFVIWRGFVVGRGFVVRWGVVVGRGYEFRWDLLDRYVEYFRNHWHVLRYHEWDDRRYGLDRCYDARFRLDGHERQHRNDRFDRRDRLIVHRKHRLDRRDDQYDRVQHIRNRRHVRLDRRRNEHGDGRWKRHDRSRQLRKLYRNGRHLDRRHELTGSDLTGAELTDAEGSRPIRAVTS